MKDKALEQQYDIIIHEQIRKRIDLSLNNELKFKFWISIGHETIDNYNEIVEKYNPWKMKICDYKIGYSFENRLRKEFRKINVNYDTGEKTVERLSGDRRGMTVRLKIEEI